MLLALRNNALWLLLMVPGTIAGGLFFALLADRVRYESVAKAIIFMPTAISFIGAGIIWRFVYDVESGGGPQIGLLNAIIVGLGGKAVTWLSNPAINNFSLMLVGVWLWAGFCMTILSAAIKGVNAEILEASRVDGANEWQVFWEILFPSIQRTIVVVTTTMAIIILKIFDVVFVMTDGNFGTEVIANRMFSLDRDQCRPVNRHCRRPDRFDDSDHDFQHQPFSERGGSPMKPLARFNRFFSKLPLHLAVILMCVLWIIPTLGLFVTSFRSRAGRRHHRLVGDLPASTAGGRETGVQQVLRRLPWCQRQNAPGGRPFQLGHGEPVPELRPACC